MIRFLKFTVILFTFSKFISKNEIKITQQLIAEFEKKRIIQKKLTKPGKLTRR